MRKARTTSSSERARSACGGRAAKTLPMPMLDASARKPKTLAAYSTVLAYFVESCHKFNLEEIERRVWLYT